VYESSEGGSNIAPNSTDETDKPIVLFPVWEYVAAKLERERKSGQISRESEW